MLTQRFRQLRALSEHVTEEQSVTAAASLHRWASPINDLPAGPDTGTLLRRIASDPGRFIVRCPVSGWCR
jgi:hypothetical protein